MKFSEFFSSSSISIFKMVKMLVKLRKMTDSYDPPFSSSTTTSQYIVTSMGTQSFKLVA